MSDFGVLYFNHGRPHLARLVTSLWSLRKHYQGRVAVADTGHSGGVIERIEADSRLNVEIVKVAFLARPKNSCYCMKASLWRDSPFGSTLFLDSDTLPVRDPAPLIGIICAAGNPGFVVTRFSNWLTSGDIYRGRLEKWRGVRIGNNSGEYEKSIDVESLVDKNVNEPHPAINTGVMGWRDDARTTLKLWERVTRAGWKAPFTDEYAAQLLLRKVPHTLVADRYNCSPIYGSEKAQAIIWHFHGSKHCLRDGGRGEHGHPLWFPVFREAWDADVAGITKWAPADDRALAAHLPIA
jgi:hypothetical protein